MNRLTHITGTAVFVATRVNPGRAQYPQDGCPSFAETSGGGFDAPEFGTLDSGLEIDASAYVDSATP